MKFSINQYKTLAQFEHALNNPESPNQVLSSWAIDKDWGIVVIWVFDSRIKSDDVTINVSLDSSVGQGLPDGYHRTARENEHLPNDWGYPMNQKITGR